MGRHVKRPRIPASIDCVAGNATCNGRTAPYKQTNFRIERLRCTLWYSSKLFHTIPGNHG
jgi:hypothetical protein